MPTKTEMEEEFKDLIEEGTQVSGEWTNEILGAVADCEVDVEPDMIEAGLDEEEREATCAVIAVKALWDAYQEALTAFEDEPRAVLKEIVEASKPAPRPDPDEEEEAGEDEEDEDDVEAAEDDEEAEEARTFDDEVTQPIPIAAPPRVHAKPAPTPPVLKAPKLKN